jgi:hypothetical protein
MLKPNEPNWSILAKSETRSVFPLLLNLNTNTDKYMKGDIQLPNKKIKLVNTTILVTFRFDFTAKRLFLSTLTSFGASEKSVSS